jgi:hypothetical protein
MLTRPARLLKLEDSIFFIGCLLLYSHLHLSWLLFAILFLGPDLFMLGYLFGPKTASALYNVAHTYITPALVLSSGIGFRHPQLVAVSLIWISHIAFDRVLGYGLKYPTHFKDTHLQHL